VKACERREVVDRASQKGLPRVRCNKAMYEEQPDPWPRVHIVKWHYASLQQARGWEDFGLTGLECRMMYYLNLHDHLPNMGFLCTLSIARFVVTSIN
jgi:hypothetical protein